MFACFYCCDTAKEHYNITKTYTNPAGKIIR